LGLIRLQNIPEKGKNKNSSDFIRWMTPPLLFLLLNFDFLLSFTLFPFPDEPSICIFATYHQFNT